MSKSNGQKIGFSTQAEAALEMLLSAKAAEDPFQELALSKAVIRNLVQKDLISESHGVDGTVKYSITGRGQALLKSGNYYTFNRSRGNGRKHDCELCEHRQLLEMVKARIPAVRRLEEKREELGAMKDALRAGDGDDAETIRDMYQVVTDIDGLLERLEAYSDLSL